MFAVLVRTSATTDLQAKATERLLCKPTTDITLRNFVKLESFHTCTTNPGLNSEFSCAPWVLLYPRGLQITLVPFSS
jgi:hypothetical protein